MIAIVVVLAILALIILRSRRNDPVASFQRHIDALGPEARRPTVDRVRRLDDDSDETDDDGR
ncbi:MAG: hypothetical protein AAF945_20235 [Actinomycetota bacterium]